MVPLLGMAGLAEAGEAVALMIGYGALGLLGLLAAVGWFRRSRVTCVIALIAAAALTSVFTPWEVFRSFESDDPDVHYWVAAWRAFACWSGVAAAVALAATIRACCLRGKTQGRAEPADASEEAFGKRGRD